MRGIICVMSALCFADCQLLSLSLHWAAQCRLGRHGALAWRLNWGVMKRPAWTSSAASLINLTYNLYCTQDHRAPLHTPHSSSSRPLLRAFFTLAPPAAPPPAAVALPVKVAFDPDVTEDAENMRSASRNRLMRRIAPDDACLPR